MALRVGGKAAFSFLRLLFSLTETGTTQTAPALVGPRRYHFAKEGE
jgi:hypothetical protein